MKKIIFSTLLVLALNVTKSQDAGYCKFMRLVFACADTNFALFADPDDSWKIKPSVLQAGGFVSGEMIGQQHMTFVLTTSDASHYPENQRDSMIIATFNSMVKNIKDNCYPELAMSMDMIRFSGKNTVLTDDQIISKYLLYFKEIESGMNFPVFEGLEQTPHLEISLHQNLAEKNLYHIEYMFFTAKGFQIFSQQ